MLRVVTSPSEAFTSIRLSSTASAIGFAFFSFLLGAVLQSSVDLGAVRLLPDGRHVHAGAMWIGIAVGCAASSVLWLAWCLPEWIGLRLIGASDARLLRQLRVASWAMAPVPILAILPGIGIPLAGIWMAVLRIVGTVRAQHVHPGEALTVVLGPLLVLLALFFGLRGDRIF